MCCVPRATLTVETALAWMGPVFWWMLTVALMSILTLSKCLLSACHVPVVLLGLGDAGEMGTLWLCP